MAQKTTDIPIEVYKKPDICLAAGISFKDFDALEDMFDNRIREEASMTTDMVIYNTIPSEFVSMETWPTSSNLKCWNCDMTFNDRPKPGTTGSAYRDKNGREHLGTYGNFCTFNCSQTDMDIRYRGATTKNDCDRALRKIYFAFYGKQILIIKPSVDKTRRQEYCGPTGLTHKEYREEMANLNNEYELTCYKMEHLKAV